MEVNDPQGPVNLQSRGMVGRMYVWFQRRFFIFSFAMPTRVPNQSAVKPYAPVPDDALHEI